MIKMDDPSNIERGVILKEAQRWLMKQALRPIQSMVESGRITPDMALGILAEQSGQFQGNDDTSEYKKFKEKSGLIYANEPFFDVNYRMETGDVYTFRPASYHDVHTLYKLYQHCSGKGYNSPEQLKEVMRELLDGKRVLELGSGPGFNLKVLQDLGARVSGVEVRQNLIGGVPDVDVRYGDAEHLDGVFPDEQFDLVYSRDLFCTAVMNQEKSGKIATQTHRHTKDNGGIGIHQITYEKIGLPLYLLGMWLSSRETGRNYQVWEEWFWNMPDEERERVLYTNRCSLDLQDLVMPGFKVKEYSVENGELNIVVKR